MVGGRSEDGNKNMNLMECYLLEYNRGMVGLNYHAAAKLEHPGIL